MCTIALIAPRTDCSLNEQAHTINGSFVFIRDFSHAKVIIILNDEIAVAF